MESLKHIAPNKIEGESFTIIDREFHAQTGLNPAEIDFDQYQVIRRVIHATGDFGFAKQLVFHDEAIGAAIKAIKSGRDIYIDVTMGASGISKSILGRFGGTVRCHINDPEIADKAAKEGKTRTETALEKISSTDVGIIAVGNAPTALIAAMQMIENKMLKPALIVGVPVGFVNAEESKDILLSKSYPFITNKGRKGGSPVAVAIINALLRISEQSV